MSRPFMQDLNKKAIVFLSTFLQIFTKICYNKMYVVKL